MLRASPPCQVQGTTEEVAVDVQQHGPASSSTDDCIIRTAAGPTERHKSEQLESVPNCTPERSVQCGFDPCADDELVAMLQQLHEHQENHVAITAEALEPHVPRSDVQELTAACKARWAHAARRPARAWPLLRAAACFRAAQDEAGRCVVVPASYQQLEQLLAACTCPTVFDLGGATLRCPTAASAPKLHNGPLLLKQRQALVISAPGVTIRNGDLILPPGGALVAAASGGSVLEDLGISGEGAVGSGCPHDFCQPVGLVEARGPGVTLTLLRCTVSVVKNAGFGARSMAPATCGVLAIEQGSATVVHSTITTHKASSAPGFKWPWQQQPCQPFPLPHEEGSWLGGLVAHGRSSMMEAHNCTVTGHLHGFQAASGGSLAATDCTCERAAGTGFIAAGCGELMAGPGCTVSGAGRHGFCAVGQGALLVAGPECVARSWGASAQPHLSTRRGAPGTFKPASLVAVGNAGLAAFAALGGAHMELGSGCMATAGWGTGFLAQGQGSAMVAGDQCSALQCACSGFDTQWGATLLVGAEVRSTNCGAAGFSVQGTGAVMVLQAGAHMHNNRGSNYNVQQGGEMRVRSSSQSSRKMD